MKMPVLLNNLHHTFYPRSIAVVGANPDPEKVGYNILNSILSGGFQGKIFPVHPRHRGILGLKTFSDLNEAF